MTTRPDAQSFDHLPRLYDRFAELVGGELHAYLRDRLPPRGGRAVDLGCGTGLHTVLLAQRFHEVLAVDVSEPMLALARQKRPRSNVRYQHRDLRDVTPGRDGTFDCVLSAYTLHHVPNFDVALRQIRALARAGGTVILVDIVDDRRQVPRSWHRREAWRALTGDLRQRRRPVREALELLRLQLNPDWLDHVSTDHVLSPAEWATRTTAVFPPAEVTALYRAQALRWRDPHCDHVLPDRPADAE
jgi:SAM-dependent methyltransferase